MTLLRIIVHPLFFLPLGPLGGVFAARWITRKLALRGFRSWGILSGLGAMVGLLLLIQWGLVLSFQDAFAGYGPCAVCYEWSYVPFLLWWGSWTLGLILFGILSVVMLLRPPLKTIPSQGFMPSTAWRWIGGLGAAAVLIYGAGAGADWLRTRQARDRLSQQVTSIQSTQLVESGSIQLKRPPTPLLIGDFIYVEPGGIRFSPDGMWMALTFQEGIELWDYHRLERVLSYEKSELLGGEVAFTQDSSQLFLLDGYNLLIWDLPIEGDRPAESLDFSQHRPERVFPVVTDHALLIGQDHVVYLDPGTAYPSIVADLPETPSGGARTTFNENGELVARWDGAQIWIYNTGTSELVGYLSLTVETTEQEPRVWGKLRFLPDDRLLFWGSVGSDEVGLIWDPEMHQTTLIDLPHFQELPQMAIHPRGRIAVFTNRTEATVLDLGGDLDQETLTLPDAVTALVFTPNGKVLVVGTAGGLLRFYVEDG